MVGGVGWGRSPIPHSSFDKLRMNAPPKLRMNAPLKLRMNAPLKLRMNAPISAANPCPACPDLLNFPAANSQTYTE